MSKANTQTHHAIALTSKGALGVVDVPTRDPGPEEVQIKVQYASYGSHDAHVVDDNYFVQSYPFVIGLGASGQVTKVGSKVNRLKEGDWVVAFTQPVGDRGMQEYVTVPAHRVAPIPSDAKISADSASVLIDNFVCAWWTITSSFGLPLAMGDPELQIPAGVASTPIVVWGAGTASGLYTIQLLHRAGYTNIIATASSRTSARAFAAGATHVFDYNDPEIAKKILGVAGSEPIRYALDSVCTSESLNKLSRVVKTPGAKVAVLIPIKRGNLTNLSGGGGELIPELPQEANPFEVGVEIVITRTFHWETDENLKHNLLNEVLPELMREGSLKTQDVHLIREGTLLDRVNKARELVRSGQLGTARAVVDFTA